MSIPSGTSQATEPEASAIPAVVLAGGKASEALASLSGATYKGAVDVGGKTLLDRTLSPLAASESVSNLAVVAPTDIREALEDSHAVVWVESTDSLIGNLLAGVAEVGGDRPVLVVSGDLPLLRTADVDSFIREGRATGAELVYSIVGRSACDEAFPGTRRTYVKLREGTFTGGNVMLLSPDFTRRNAAVIQEVFALRKKPLALCRLLGLGFVLKLVLGWLTVAGVVRRVEEILHCRAAAVQTGASIALDLDKPEDLELAERLIADCAVPGSAPTAPS